MSCLRCATSSAVAASHKYGLAAPLVYPLLTGGASPETTSKNSNTLESLLSTWAIRPSVYRSAEKAGLATTIHATNAPISFAQTDFAIPLLIRNSPNLSEQPAPETPSSVTAHSALIASLASCLLGGSLETTYAAPCRTPMMLLA
jgi:hypothetical protein